MARAKKGALTNRRADTETGFPEEEVDIPGIGTVLVRGLSRLESMRIFRLAGENHEKVERLTVSYGLVDPQLSEDEVGEWQKHSLANEMNPVMLAIQRLSGFSKDAQDKAFDEFEADPGSEFRLPASGDSSHAGGEAAPDVEQ